MADAAAPVEGNGRNIPACDFIDNVSAFLADQGLEPEAAIKRHDELYRQYSLMKQSLSAKHGRVLSQIPGIEASLKAVRMLKTKAEAGEDVSSTFKLADNLFAKAKVPPTQTVGLWLGANVMLEYPLDEAESMLADNLETAQKRASGLETDLEFVQEQIVTTEVNMARIYNHDVRQKRK
eukprot:m.484979 g.484979  ORF g.484979 m.484979 type:complete len:179 (+) comp23612_c0_seq1:180-716(+)